MPANKTTQVKHPPRWLVRTASVIHRWLYRFSRGKLGTRVGEMPVLLLTTTGRKSGKRRTTPLCYLEHPDGWVVPAFNAGYDYEPLWWKNLKANARGEVHIGGTSQPIRARIATASEQKAYTARMVSVAPDYQEHQDNSTREFPMVVLGRA